MDPLPPNFLSSPSGRVLLSLLFSNRSRFAEEQRKTCSIFSSSRQQLGCLASFAGGLARPTPYSVSWCLCPTGICVWQWQFVEMEMEMQSIRFISSRHLYSSWVAAGLTKDDLVPDFSAMYSGTPDRWLRCSIFTTNCCIFEWVEKTQLACEGLNPIFDTRRLLS